MYITRIEIENIRSIDKLVWEISEDQAPGWHVVIGDNGSGKTTLVRAVAVAVLGSEDALALCRPWRNWLNKNRNSDLCKVVIGVKENRLNGIASFEMVRSDHFKCTSSQGESSVYTCFGRRYSTPSNTSRWICRRK